MIPGKPRRAVLLRLGLSMTDKRQPLRSQISLMAPRLCSGSSVVAHSRLWGPAGALQSNGTSVSEQGCVASVTTGACDGATRKGVWGYLAHWRGWCNRHPR